VPIRKLYTDMLEFGESAGSRKFSVPDLTKVLRRFAGSDDIKLSTKRDDKVDRNQVVVGGLYDPHEDEANFSSIFIYIHFNPKQKNIYIKDIDWPQTCVNLIECVGHEIIHQEQFRSRDFDIGPHLFVSKKEDRELRDDQEYLGNPDEIEAYGYSIAAEIYLKDNPAKISGRNVVKTAMYKTYCKTFGPNHPIVRQVLEHTLKYYTKLKAGGSYVKEPEQCRST
jgi:hypothetical protein